MSAYPFSGLMVIYDCDSCVANNSNTALEHMLGDLKKARLSMSWIPLCYTTDVNSIAI